MLVAQSKTQRFSDYRGQTNNQKETKTNMNEGFFVCNDCSACTRTGWSVRKIVQIIHSETPLEKEKLQLGIAITSKCIIF